MAYSGKYKIKNRHKYRGDADNVIYRSLWEKKAFIWCEDNSEIKWWASEELAIQYFYEVDKRHHRYFPDLVIEFNNGKRLMVEIKPKKETRKPEFKGRKTKRYINESVTFVKNMNKWEAASKVAKDNGWEFQIWTEETLQKMGILPKKIKSLKPLKPLKTK